MTRKLLLATAILLAVNLAARAADYDLNETLTRARIVLKLEKQTGKPVYLNDKKVTGIYEATKDKALEYLGQALDEATKDKSIWYLGKAIGKEK